MSDDTSPCAADPIWLRIQSSDSHESEVAVVFTAIPAAPVP
ncbi:Hypothetical protein I596_227 [Dokdonella koreensis DS-123]|uniref:Uncharacterized protein n=1 Tax=Dokdonella koreensis DS-123 TaxID=1300342 RepID=A0A167G8L8_9GAMM|nr:Hypothetical protein I596_227 [Dokdonella koreensis DS-123]